MQMYLPAYLINALIITPTCLSCYHICHFHEIKFKLVYNDFSKLWYLLLTLLPSRILYLPNALTAFNDKSRLGL